MTVGTAARRVGIIGLGLEVDKLPLMATDTYMKHFGSNVGNLAFSYAVHNQIASPKGRVWSLNLPAEKLREHFDVLVFPAANNINAREDLGWLANLIEKSGLPMVIIGIGVQASSAEDKFPLPPGTQRFLSVVRDHNITLGVRGDFTRQFLLDRQVQNVVVTGCPSSFLNPDLQLGSLIAKAFAELPEEPSIALNLEYFRLETEKTRVLTSWVRKQGGFMVFQSDENVIALHRHDPAFNNADPEYVRKVSYFAKYFLGSQHPQDFVRFAAQYGRTFIHLPSWMDALRAVDLSVGTRFHGNMLALQVGRPAVVFTHDTRTLELCQVTGVPHLPWSDIGAQDNIASVLKRVRFDADAYDRRRREKAKLCRSLYEAAGIDVSSELKALAA